MIQLEYFKNSARVSPGPHGVLIHSKLLGCSKRYLATHTAHCDGVNNKYSKGCRVVKFEVKFLKA